MALALTSCTGTGLGSKSGLLHLRRPLAAGEEPADVADAVYLHLHHVSMNAPSAVLQSMTAAKHRGTLQCIEPQPGCLMPSGLAMVSPFDNSAAGLSRRKAEKAASCYPGGDPNLGRPASRFSPECSTAAGANSAAPVGGSCRGGPAGSCREAADRAGSS